ncbi:MAG TPA: hypothetical protein VH079_09735 [Terriglobales bacterium]|jgi:hypothetical protein|nr:hypothetical protein [Terriglobales bacterium]
MSAAPVLIDVLLAGFFAIACVRAREPIIAGQKMTLVSLFSLSSRVERLKRTKWQWFSMVFLVLIFRLQGYMSVMLELMVASEFVLFVALPVQASARNRAVEQ